MYKPKYENLEFRIIKPEIKSEFTQLNLIRILLFTKECEVVWVCVDSSKG